MWYCNSPGIVHTSKKKQQLHIFADTGYISGKCAREWVWLDVSSKMLTLRPGWDFLKFAQKEVAIFLSFIVTWTKERHQLAVGPRVSNALTIWRLQACGVGRPQMGSQRAWWQHGEMDTQQKHQKTLYICSTCIICKGYNIWVTIWYTTIQHTFTQYMLYILLECL